jgi:hypothetical protein
MGVFGTSASRFTALLKLCQAKYLQLLKLYSSKNVKFKANSTFFMEHLRGYSRNPSVKAPRGVVRILPPTVTDLCKKRFVFFYPASSSLYVGPAGFFVPLHWPRRARPCRSRPCRVVRAASAPAASGRGLIPSPLPSLPPKVAAIFGGLNGCAFAATRGSE